MADLSIEELKVKITRKSLVLSIATTSIFAGAQAQTEPFEDRGGVLHIPAMTLPPSSLLSDETKTVLKQLREGENMMTALVASHCGDVTGDDPERARATRTCLAESFYKSAFYRDVLGPYDVSVTREMMDGVLTEVFVPKAGVAAANTKRVLINVHGGGFMGGARTASHIESIPIAAIGRIKVVSVDYRQGPEHVYPAATDDVEAVYRALLKSYDPEQIGLYGCSAGGLLTAQTVATADLSPMEVLCSSIFQICQHGRPSRIPHKLEKFAFQVSSVLIGLRHSGRSSQLDIGHSFDPYCTGSQCGTACLGRFGARILWGSSDSRVS